MQTITATVPVTLPPSWAAQQRLLLATMSDSISLFLDRYTHDDGELIYDDSWGGGADDFYEGYTNWPLLYLMGGKDHLVEESHRGWETVTRQLTRRGQAHKEYARSMDTFHQSESDVFFYHLCLADPAAGQLEMRARRFAGFYLNEDPEVRNYDPEHRILLSARLGSGGPYYTPDEARETASHRSNETYGLPFYDLPGIESYEDTLDPANARLMGQAVHDRWQKGEVVGNLSVTSLVTNAFLLTGEEKYRDWVLEYTDAWMSRARENDWLLPDNVGHSGAVGEYLDGKWYGGLYGWTYPHGWYNIQMTALTAAANAYLLTRDDRYLELPRKQMDRILDLGEQRDVRETHMSLRYHWIGQLTAMGDRHETFLVPYRYGDAGWFDWQPPSPIFLSALWNLSMADQDWERIERVRQLEAYDWNEVVAFHNKEDGGHDQPWLRYLAGENPTHPERILQASYQQVVRRLAVIRADSDVGARHSEHRWQEANPVTTEGLLQLICGAPQPIYNGGLLFARLTYFDTQRKRPGLPEDVAALVEKVESRRTVVHLVNLNPMEGRELIVQAGAFGEHSFRAVRYSALTSQFPGAPVDYAAPPVGRDVRTTSVDGKHLRVSLPSGTQITLDLDTARFTNEPAYAGPV
ncbi:MAG: hypothetical protein VCE12_20630 [Candidatus Latescibacterota bacterium]